MWKCELDPKTETFKHGCAYAHPTILVGGFAVNLCPKHRNEWHEYIVARGEGVEYARIKEQMKKSDQADDFLLQQAIDTEKELYEIAKAWFLGKKEQLQEAP